jgi:hypothetical protein|tara:strand:- start:726 stop:1211 length:486 start_codon:yes stop_codon:yes gene_type:complete
MENKMEGKLLIFEEIMNKVKKSKKKGLILLGEENYVTSNKIEYGLVFHYKEEIENPLIVRDLTSLVIPVIEKQDKKNNPLYIYENYLENKDFDKIAIYEKEKDVLNIYNILRDKLGTEVHNITSTVKEQDFFDLGMSQGMDFKKEIIEKKKIIDKEINKLL